MSDEYVNISKGKLKLKNDQIKKKKNIKKKQKNKEMDDDDLQQTKVDHTQESGCTYSTTYERKLTKAELASKKQQEKMRNRRIMEKAQTTHKQRVEKFNEHLDTLTEHFDIPKVSWTK